VDSFFESRDETGPAPLVRLRRAALLLAAAAAVGAFAGLIVGWTRAPRYRATATLLVVEPRGAPPGSVDFQLTPVRSYTALLTSPALAAMCASGAPAPAVKVRVPESTRLLEVSAEGADPAATAAFTACLAARAQEENRRLNADVARRGEAQVATALAAARADLESREEMLSRRRAALHLEVSRAKLKAALSDLARATSTERGVLEKRAALLDREVASAEDELDALKRRVANATSGVAELERRSALAPLESATKAFDLVVVAPAPAVAHRSGPAVGLLAAVGVFAGAFLAMLGILSRPQ
jgi:hypothetical protein